MPGHVPAVDSTAARRLGGRGDGGAASPSFCRGTTRRRRRGGRRRQPGAGAAALARRAVGARRTRPAGAAGVASTPRCANGARRRGRAQTPLVAGRTERKEPEGIAARLCRAGPERLPAADWCSAGHASRTRRVHAARSARGAGGDGSGRGSRHTVVVSRAFDAAACATRSGRTVHAAGRGARSPEQPASPSTLSSPGRARLPSASRATAASDLRELDPASRRGTGLGWAPTPPCKAVFRSLKSEAFPKPVRHHRGRLPRSCGERVLGGQDTSPQPSAAPTCTCEPPGSRKKATTRRPEAEPAETVANLPVPAPRHL